VAGGKNPGAAERRGRLGTKPGTLIRGDGIETGDPQAGSRTSKSVGQMLGKIPERDPTIVVTVSNVPPDAGGGQVKALIRLEVIEQRILLIRGQKVMLSTHLAELYDVETRASNQAAGFPKILCFSLIVLRRSNWYHKM